MSVKRWCNVVAGEGSISVTQSMQLSPSRSETGQETCAMCNAAESRLQATLCGSNGRNNGAAVLAATAHAAHPGDAPVTAVRVRERHELPSQQVLLLAIALT